MMDLREGVELEQFAHAPVLRALVARLEEPGVDLLAFARAGVQHLGQRCAGATPQIADQPEFERMHARDIAAICERQAGVGVVQRLQRALRGGAAARLLHQQRVELRLGSAHDHTRPRGRVFSNVGRQVGRQVCAVLRRRGAVDAERGRADKRDNREQVLSHLLRRGHPISRDSVRSHNGTQRVRDRLLCIGWQEPLQMLSICVVAG